MIFLGFSDDIQVMTWRVILLLICFFPCSAFSYVCVGGRSSNINEAKKQIAALESYGKIQESWDDDKILKDSHFSVFNKIRAAEANALERITNCGIRPSEVGLDSIEAISELKKAAFKNTLTHVEETFASRHFTDPEMDSSRTRALDQALVEAGFEGNEHKRRLLRFHGYSKIGGKLTRAYAKDLRTKASCSTKLLEEKLPPIRHQGKSGLCYAFAAADLLSFKSGKNISPLGVGLAIHIKSEGSEVRPQANEIDLKSGITSSSAIQDAVEAATQHGYCLDKDFGNTVDHNSQIFGDKRAQNSPYDNAYHDFVTEIALASQQTEIDKDRIKRDVEGKTFCNLRSQTAKHRFPGLDAESLAKILSSQSKDEAYLSAFNNLCKTRSINTPVEVSTVQIKSDSPSELLDKIDKEFDENKILSIAYNPNKLFSPRAGVTGAFHGSTLVGRRFNEATGVCEYQLRNSWGARCEMYKVTRGTSYPCDSRGQLWLPADAVVGLGVLSITKFSNAP